MSKGLLFWILFILAAIAWFGGPFWGLPSWGNGVLFFVLIGLLGWHNFGPPIQ